MKNTLQETVSEIYKKTNNNNYTFIGNKNMNSIIKNANKNNGLNKNNTFNKNSSFNNKNNLVNKNNTVNKNNAFNYSNTPINSNTPIIIFSIIILSIFLVLYFFKDNITNYINSLFKEQEPEQEQEPEKSKDYTENTNKLKQELERLKSENSKLIKYKNQQHKLDNTNKINNLKQKYSDSQIVKQDDSYCFIGTDNNTRHCVKAYTGDICKSGDVYNRIDECLIPKY